MLHVFGVQVGVREILWDLIAKGVVCRQSFFGLTFFLNMQGPAFSSIGSTELQADPDF